MDQKERITSSTVNNIHQDQPLVDVVIVNSRGNNQWYQQAHYSACTQTYGNMGLVVVDNNDHALSIGAAYNLGTRASEAKYVLFVGDDDYISIDLVAHLATTMETLRQQPALTGLLLVSSGMTMVDTDNKVLGERIPHSNGVDGLSYMQAHHTGLIDRAWLMANPFNHFLDKHVSTDMQRRIQSHGKAINAVTVWASSYHYGYHYRQHIGMASGEKIARRLSRYERRHPVK